MNLTKRASYLGLILIRRLLSCYNQILIERGNTGKKTEAASHQMRIEEIQILRETRDYIAVYKPAGLPVQTRSPFQQDLELFLSRRALESGGEKSDRSMKAVNRLDLPVEGIVLLAKNKKAAADLSEQLRKGEIQKHYLAVVQGVPKKKKARLEDYLIKDVKTNRTCILDDKRPGARRAILDYEVLEEIKSDPYMYPDTEEDPEDANLALLDIHLLTGRHHQIRAQLSFAGLPILGDRKYGFSNNKKNPPFPALCASELAFRDPSDGDYIQLEITPRGEAFSCFHRFLS